MNPDDVEFAAIDFESAGTAPSLAEEPVQIAVVHMRAGVILPAINSYLRPTRPVTWAAKAVHGISDAQLANAPRLIDLWPQVKSSLEFRPVVAHGAATEKRFLRVFPLHGFGPWLDTLTLTRRIFPTLESHSLSDAIQSLGLANEAELTTPGFRWHDAACDATASLVLIRHLIHAVGFEILNLPTRKQ